ncbi:MAG: lysophospholipase [Actinomycetota bacterium]|nr:lysophospholipase [Actinomycetota bacterium]
MTQPTERELAVVCDGLMLAGGVCEAVEPRGTAVLLHGIPTSAPRDPEDAGYPGLARRFASEGWTSVWAEMRGVRNSGGYFSIEGWVADARAIVDAARALDGVRSPLVLIGSSAGGAVSVEAVTRGASVDALALLAAPAAWVSFADDPPAAVKRITVDAGMALAPETLADPTTWAAEFESVITEASIGRITVPVLIVHGTADDVVPVDHAHRLAERAPSAQLRIIEGAPHQLRRNEEAIAAVLRWMDLVR